MNVLSLESISVNQIVGQITSNVLCLYELSCSDDGDLYITEEVKKRILSLKLPFPSSELMKEKVGTILAEVKQYFSYLEMCGVCISKNLASKLTFTMKGRINFKLSTRKIVRDKYVDLNTRVILASMFCFEEEVLELWTNHPDEFRKSAKQAPFTTVCYWVKHLEDLNKPSARIFGNWISVLSAFPEAVKNVHLEAAEYFYKKMDFLFMETKLNVLQMVEDYLDRDTRQVEIFFKQRLKYFLRECQVKENILFWRNLTLKNNALREQLERYEIKNKENENKIQMVHIEDNKLLMLMKDLIKNEDEISKKELEEMDRERSMLKTELQKLYNLRILLDDVFRKLISEFKKLKDEEERWLNL